MSDFVIQNGVLKEYLGNDEVVVIPEGVTTIAREAFYNRRRSLRIFSSRRRTRKIIIPKTVTSISDYAFADCYFLTNVVISDSVTSIGKYAFECCRSLKSINIPASVTKIGDSAFYGCDSLEAIHITDLAAWCNIEFASFTSTPLCNDRRSTGSKELWLYLNGKKVSDLIIPHGVTKINNFAFYYYSKLKSAIISETVTSIGASAFGSCCSLTSVTIPNSVTSIGASAFETCSSLTSIKLPISLTHIESNAFRACVALESVNIPESVVEIGYGTFGNCNALKDVHICDIGHWCSIKFKDRYSNPLNFVQNWCPNGQPQQELVIPDGTTTIEDYAFVNCKNITSICVPDSILMISDNAFLGCDNLTTLIFPIDSVRESYYFINALPVKNINITNLGTWCARDVKCYGKELHNLYYNGELITELVIPEGVTSIGNNAFENNQALVSVTIPATVTTIGEDAFKGCCSLERLNITDLTAWCEIVFGNEMSNPLHYAKSIYLNDEPIKQLVLPETISIVNKYAFYHCTSLISVKIPPNITSIEDMAFRGCSSLKKLEFSSEINIIAYKAFAECSSLSEIIMPPKGILESSSTAFEGCPTKPQSVKKADLNGHRLLSICSKEEAELQTPGKKPTYLCFVSYDDYDYNIIRKEADNWQILSVHSVGSDYGYSSRDCDVTQTHYEIEDSKILVENGRFAGIVECSDASSYMKGMSYDTGLVVALAKNATTGRASCGRYGTSFSSDDHESWNTTTHYLVRRGYKFDS